VKSFGGWPKAWARCPFDSVRPKSPLLATSAGSGGTQFICFGGPQAHGDLEPRRYNLRESVQPKNFHSILRNCVVFAEVLLPNKDGLIQVDSHYSLNETVQRLQNTFVEKGLKVFALIDHSGEAEKVGLKMAPTKVIIFGSPKAGTPLMVAAPSLAIDLPMKALVAENSSGKVTVTYNDPEYLRERHGFPAELTKNLAGAGALLAKAVE
jgi:uncharacterized protein (DUF302 family)